MLALILNLPNQPSDKDQFRLRLEDTVVVKVHLQECSSSLLHRLVTIFQDIRHSL